MLDMKRREFISLLGGAAAWRSRPARTHAAVMVPQIGGIGRPGKGVAWAGCGMK
jgi:hypothetical protein